MFVIILIIVIMATTMLINMNRHFLKMFFSQSFRNRFSTRLTTWFERYLLMDKMVITPNTLPNKSQKLGEILSNIAKMLLHPT